MSDVIEVMARAANDGTESLDATMRDIVDALRAAEQAGWQYLPAEPDEDMLVAAEEEFGRFCDLDGVDPEYATNAVLRIYAALTQAAPRPWEETE